MEKQKYEFLKDVKRRLAAGEKTTFAERNILAMENKKQLKKLNKAMRGEIDLIVVTNPEKIKNQNEKTG